MKRRFLGDIIFRKIELLDFMGFMVWYHLNFLNPCTVNVIIFAGGKFRENVGKTFHVGVIFTIRLLIFPS